MFDIGFTELLLIGVVGLLVIGPERLPGAIRTVTAYLGRLRRGFDEVKAEVQRELHNDEVLQQLRDSANAVQEEINDTRDALAAETKQLKQTVNEGMPDNSGDRQP